MKNFIICLFIITDVFAQDFFTPTWTKDLIIYEISTKNFTSTNGPGTGTFNSTKEKIPYLADLGINAVWLSGHNWADTGHFYGIWTQYATIRPDSIDHSLGTREDLKTMVNAFHKKEIKVFLDIITHGVMSNSPLVKEHPKWFKGGSWGMKDYDWDGKHADLDDWWIKTHVDYVLNQGIDGYRLDVDIYRADLWKEIKKQCSERGHPIVVFLENRLEHDNTCDFYQKNLTISNQKMGVDSTLTIISNTAKFFNNYYNGKEDFKVQIKYEDGTEEIGYSPKGGIIGVEKIYQPVIKPLEKAIRTDYKGDYTELLLKNIDTSKYVTSIQIRGRYFLKSAKYKLEKTTNYDIRFKLGGELNVALKPIVPDVVFTSLQLSAHDDGWDQFPAKDNPYVAEGSRCLFGYSFLFTPSIPFFMSGDEFDAKFVPHPNLTPDLYGKIKSRNGTWLYGSVIDWEQLKQENHKEMLKDVKKMISIRISEKDIFHSYKNDEPADIFALEFNCKEQIPVPYAIQNKDKAIIIAGNNTSKDVLCTIKLPLDYMKISGESSYKIVDLWNNKKWKVKGNDLKNFSFKIKNDKSAKGGMAIFKIIKQ